MNRIAAFVTLALAAVGWAPAAHARQAAVIDCNSFTPSDIAADLVQAFVTKMATPLYKDPAGSATAATATLKFSDHVAVRDKGSGDRIKVERKDVQNPAVGWVDKANLMCRVEAPRSADTGIFRRAFVRTERYETGAAQAPGERTGDAVSIYQNSQGGCEGGPDKCVKVSRLQWFYIWAEENDHYLVSTFYAFRGRSPTSASPMFVGWLPKSRAILWSTGLALRPSIELADQRNGSDEQHVCAYATPEDIGQESRDPKKCSKTYGGRRWFRRSSRLALLEQTDKYYKVAAAASLVGENSRAAGGQASGPSAYDGLDVVFVVDGTASMTKAIAAIKGRNGNPGLVQMISRKILEKHKEAGGIRFGYQIYRDSAPVRVSSQLDGVNDPDVEKLDISRASCASNADAFEKNFARVTAREASFPGSYVDDDDPENSFLGIYTALNQFASCPNHAKILIHIGDHGYDAAKQMERGRSAIDLEALATKMRRDERSLSQGGSAVHNESIYYLSVQTPEDKTGVKNPDKYDEAYKKFTSQAAALALASRAFAGIPSAQAQQAARDATFQMSPNDSYDLLSSQIVDKVSKRYTDARSQFESIEEESRVTGRPIAEIIDRRAGSENAPMDVTIMLKRRMCADYGERCMQSAVDAVGEAYFARTPDTEPKLTFDVMMLTEELSLWSGLLSAIGETGGSMRDDLVNALLNKLSTIFRYDPRRDQSILEQMAGASLGLPGAALGKLLQYSPDDLQAADSCEIGRVAAYSRIKGAALDTLKGGKQRPILRSPANDPGCNGGTMRANRRIPIIRLDGVQPLAPPNMAANERDEYKINWPISGNTYFWIPVEYLP